MQRYKDSGHTSIKAMSDGRNATIPLLNNKPVCLAWALKGACSSSCKRKDMHVHYGRATVGKIHEFLNQCGVAAAVNA